MSEHSDKQPPMIYRSDRPTANDCDTCIRNDLYCQASIEWDRRPCCDNCTHTSLSGPAGRN